MSPALKGGGKLVSGISWCWYHVCHGWLMPSSSLRWTVGLFLHASQVIKTLRIAWEVYK